MARAACLVLLLTISLPAAAQQRGLGLYAGVGLGRFQFEEDQGPLSVDVEDRLLDQIGDIVPQDISAIPGRVDASQSAFKVFGGWNVTDNLGVEVSYGRANDLTSTYTEQVGDLTVSANLSTNVDIGSARVMAYVPYRLGAFFGGLGYFNAETSSTQSVNLVVSGAGTVQRPVNLGGGGTDSGPTAIAGLQWTLPTLALRADLEWFDMNAGSAATFNLGATLGF